MPDTLYLASNPIDSDVTSNEISENIASDTTIGITAYSVDKSLADTVSYSLTDSSGGSFKIDSTTGVVTTDAVLDYETLSSHTITVEALSTDGSKNSSDFTINVTDVNEPITAVSDANVSSDTVENSSGDTLVGVTASATDEDSGDTVSYSLTDDAGGRFKINQTTGELSVTDSSDLNFEDKNSHTVTVKATSTDGTSNTKDFTINVSNVNEPITAVSDANVSSDTVPENSSGDTLVGVTASATDEDSGDTVSYSLTDDAGGRFKINETTVLYQSSQLTPQQLM